MHRLFKGGYHLSYICLRNFCNHALLARNSSLPCPQINSRALHWTALQVTHKFSALTSSIHRISNSRCSVIILRGIVNNLQLKRGVEYSLRSSLPWQRMIPHQREYVFMQYHLQLCGLIQQFYWFHKQQLQLPSPCTPDDYECGIYSRVATILLRSSLSAASI